MSWRRSWARGALRLNPFRDLHRLITGGFRDGDERFDVVTARRPLTEAVIAHLVERVPNVAVRRGVTVTGLLTGESSVAGVPDVVGCVPTVTRSCAPAS